MLGNINRLNILRLLAKNKELPVKEIRERLKLTLKLASQHLIILSHASLVQGVGKMGSVYYSFHPELSKEVRYIIEKIVQ